jgi:hypothetical protein
MRFILSIIVTFTYLSVFAQKTGEVYFSISSDTTIKSHYLVFLSDSTLEVTSVPRHHSIIVRDTLSFARKMNTIVVQSKCTMLPYDRLKLVLEGRALVDSSIKLVYVRESDFAEYFDFLYIIDGMQFIQRTGIPDSYGVVKTQFKKNKKLYSKLDELAPTINTYSLEFLRGYEAFKKYGYKYTYGVIELFRK